MPCNLLHCRHLVQVCHLSPTFLQDLLTSDPLYPQPCSSVIHSLHGPSRDSLNPTSGLIPSLFKTQRGSTSFRVRPSFRNSLQGLSWAGLLYLPGLLSYWPPTSHSEVPWTLVAAPQAQGSAASGPLHSQHSFASDTLLPGVQMATPLPWWRSCSKVTIPVKPTPNHPTENTQASSPFLVTFYLLYTDTFFFIALITIWLLLFIAPTTIEALQGLRPSHSLLIPRARTVLAYGRSPSNLL